MRIAILDDDASQIELVSQTLTALEHNCHGFSLGKSLINHMRRESFDMLILDWQLPDINGPEVLTWVREKFPPNLPVLFMTSRTNEEDIVQGLDSGADDYMIKPLRRGELVARVQALLRRAYPQAGQEDMFRSGQFLFDVKQAKLTHNGQTIDITQKEFDLALLFFRNMGRPLSRTHITETVWSREPNIPSRTMDTHVSRVRTKLQLRPETGYRLAPVYSLWLSPRTSDHLNIMLRRVSFASTPIFLCASFGSLALNLCLAQTLPSRAQWQDDCLNVTAHKADTLSEISEEFTNTSRNWQLIAKHNHIPIDKRLRQNQIVCVPHSLVSERYTQKQQANIALAISGNVHILQPNSIAQPVSIRQILPEGTRLQTGANSLAIVQLADGSKVTLPSNSVIELGKTRVDSLSGAPINQIKLIKGRVESQVTPMSHPKAQFEVHSPHAIAGVRGTVFRAALDETGQNVTTEVIEGSVQVNAPRHPNHGKILESSYGNFTNQQGRVGSPLPLLPDPILTEESRQHSVPNVKLRVVTIPSAVAYRFQVSNQAEFKTLLHETLQAEPAIELKDLADGEYFVRTSAVSVLGLEGRSGITPISVQSRPFAPNSLSSGNLVRDNRATLVWHAVFDAQSYHVQVMPQHNATQAVFESMVQSSTQIETPPLPSGNYYWRVASLSKIQNGDLKKGPYSALGQFSIRPVPTAPQPNARINAKNELEFFWPIGPKQHYLFELAADASFNQIIYTTGTAEPQLKVPTPALGNYFARIKLTDYDGLVSDYSAPLAFDLCSTHNFQLAQLLMRAPTLMVVPLSSPPQQPAAK